MLLQEMLKEKGVAPFSKWEKELPKIIFDPRFKVCALSSCDANLFFNSIWRSTLCILQGLIIHSSN